MTLRTVGLTPKDVGIAAGLYQDGWSLARLGARFGVNGSTVWKALRAQGLAMRAPWERTGGG